MSRESAEVGETQFYEGLLGRGAGDPDMRLRPEPLTPDEAICAVYPEHDDWPDTY